VRHLRPVTRRFWLALLSGVCLVTLVQARSAHLTTTIQTDQVSGVLYQPTGQPSKGALVVLGGSGGRLNAVFPAMLADQGFVVLSLAYFNAPGLPATLDQVPVETVSRALDYLSQLPAVDESAGFGVLGVSRGSELAMLAGIHDQRIQALAGILPSSVAWHGQTGPVAWTVEGVGVATLGFARQAAQPYHQRATQALSTEQAKQAQFAIEHINGSVLLASAAEDHIWPSTRMARELISRASRHGSADRVKHLVLIDDHRLDPASLKRLEAPLIELFGRLGTD
jgi:dienelactone hydrolase